MYDDKISSIISNIPVSFLEPFERSEHLSANDLLLVSQPVYGQDQLVSGYVSKSVRYDTLANSLSVSIGIPELEGRIDELCARLSLASSIIYLSSWQGPGKPLSIPRVPTVLSAFQENNRGQIVGVSGYILSNGISNVLSNIVLPRLSATISPWLLQISVRNEIGNSTVQAASQNLVSQIYGELTGNYVKKSEVNSTLGTNTGLVASQKLAYDLSNNVSSNYVNNNRLTSDLNGATQTAASTRVASQKLANDLSNQVKNNFLWIQDVVNYLGDSDVKAASQSLISAISNHVSTYYMREVENGNFVPISDIVNVFGDSTRKVASQYLATQICTYIATHYDYSGQEDKVFYLTPSGLPKKQAILDNSFLPCENQAESNLMTQSYVGDWKNLVISTWNNQVGLWNNRTRRYEGVISGDASNYLGLGRFFKNEKTRKTFYSMDGTFIKFAEYEED